MLFALHTITGCAAHAPPAHREIASISFSPQPAPIAADAAPRVQRTDDADLRQQVEAELGTEVAEALPEVKREPPEPRDPGADALVNQMLNEMGERVRGTDGVTRVCVGKVRNLSRAPASEFEQFLERFAEVLSRAGHDSEVTFIVLRNGEEAQYDLLGTAYLITAGGFDLWELFLTVTPADRGWTLWQPSGPVRVLRQPRPGQQQIFLSR